MATPIEHRCTSCGALANAIRPPLLPIGPPFADCPACKGLVERRPFEEWSGISPRTKLRILSGGGIIATAGAAIPVLAYSLIAKETSKEGWIAFLLICMAATWSLWILTLSNAIKRSNRRMSDPMYRAKLAELEIVKTRNSSSEGSPTPSK